MTTKISPSEFSCATANPTRHREKVDFPSVASWHAMDHTRIMQWAENEFPPDFFYVCNAFQEGGIEICQEKGRSKDFREINSTILTAIVAILISRTLNLPLHL